MHYLSIFSMLPQIVQASDVESDLDYEFSWKWYKTQFECIFTPVKTKSPALVKHWEFVAFYSLLRGFNKDMLRISSHKISLSIKWSSFAMHFVYPPFFSVLSHCFTYISAVSTPSCFFFIAINDPLETPHGVS